MVLQEKFRCNPALLSRKKAPHLSEKYVYLVRHMRRFACRTILYLYSTLKEAGAYPFRLSNA